jgi:hypothetical protein
MLSKLVGLVFLVLAFTSLTAAQEPNIEYGQVSELRRVTKVFVDTGADVQQRNAIVKEIQERLPNLEIVSRPEESDIHLRFLLKESKPGKTDWVGTVVKIVGNNRERVLFSYKNDTPPIFERDLLMSSAIDLAKPHVFVWQFVKQYKKANG